MAADDLIINAAAAQTFNPISSSGSSGVVGITGKYWYGSPILGEQQFDRRRIAFPGVGGFFVKDYGSRGRTFSAQIALIHTSVPLVMTAIEAVRAALVGALATTAQVPNGPTLTNVETTGLPDGPVHKLLDGKFIMLTNLTLYEME